MVVPADLWSRHREMTFGRMLAHCGIFTRIFARNCEVRRIRKPEADAFMNAAHSYGTAVCRNRYGLFTLHDTAEIPAGTLAAVAEFSNMRLIHETDRDVRSYEWIRYASLPNLRVDGGMGKVLRKFIDDIHPGDVVSYADLEWSDGEVYRTLGFRRVGTRPPVLFSIDPDTMRRIPLTGSRKASSVFTPAFYYQNFGSLRYRLIL
ncbi:MAG: hypothetical protein LUC24_02910 [Bacteroidales bacterium]|nr:hypothetical protein [Bacteroidales bacterium]